MDYREKLRKHWHAVPHVGSIITMGDLATGALTEPKPEHGDRWGIWEFDAGRLLLVAGADQGGYEIPLSEMATSARTLDWIFQIAAKKWARPEDLGNLVQALSDLLSPQANLCGCGIDRRFDVRGYLTQAAQ